MRSTLGSSATHLFPLHAAGAIAPERAAKWGRRSTVFRRSSLPIASIVFLAAISSALCARTAWPQDVGCAGDVPCNTPSNSVDIDTLRDELSSQIEAIKSSIAALEGEINSLNALRSRLAIAEAEVRENSAVIEELRNVTNRNEKSAIGVEAGTKARRCPPGQVVVGLSWSVVSQKIFFVCAELVKR